MAILPKKDGFKYKLNEQMIEPELPRPYLGLSGVGNSCHRKLQYDHYWCYAKSYSVRIKRLFQVGHDEEPKLQEAIMELGYNFHSDQMYVPGEGGHWSGHIDGIFEDIDTCELYLAEFKTHNDKSFKLLLKGGVRKSKPGHFSQVTAYMGGLGMDKCLYVAYNKNDSEIYVEIILFDKEHYDDLKRKQNEVIMADVLLPKIGTGTSSWFECKLCDARAVCHKKAKIPVTCRTCHNVDILGEGVWECSLDEKKLKSEAQKLACDEYILDDMFR